MQLIVTGQKSIKEILSELKCGISEPTVVLGAVNLISMRDWQHGERDAIKMQCSSNAILTADLASDSGRTDIPSQCLYIIVQKEMCPGPQSRHN